MLFYKKIVLMRFRYFVDILKFQVFWWHFRVSGILLTFWSCRYFVDIWELHFVDIWELHWVLCWHFEVSVILLTFGSFRFFVDILKFQVFCWQLCTPLIWWLWLTLVREFRRKTTLLVTKWSHQLKIRLGTSAIIFVDSYVGDSFKIFVGHQHLKLVTNSLIKFLLWNFPGIAVKH